MEDARTTGTAESAWRQPSPFAVNWNKLMMWAFIVTDGLLFAGFLAAYGFQRLAASTWPVRSSVFHLPFIALMTFVLISSSATMATAVGAAQRKNHGLLKISLLLTILGGLAFLGMQAYEWTALIRKGATLYSNPWGMPHFSAYFFLITGFHGSHVLSGVVILIATLLRSVKGLSRAEGVEIAGLYWHFVDLIWVFVFTFFYLI